MVSYTRWIVEAKLRKIEIAGAIYSIKYFLQAAIRVKTFQLVELCTTANIL